MENKTIGTIALGIGVVLSLGAFGVKAQQEHVQLNEANGTWKGGGDTLVIDGNKATINGEDVNVNQEQHKITFHDVYEADEPRVPLTFATVIDYELVDGELYLKNRDNGYGGTMYKGE